MNTVTLIGNLTKDPEMRGNGETKVCRMRIAESGSAKEPVYIDVAAFGRQAETDPVRSRWSEAWHELRRPV